MTVRVMGARPAMQDENVEPGLAVRIDDGLVVLIDDDTQESANSRTPWGVAMTNGTEADIVVEGEVNGVAGTGGVKAGELVAAEAGTGRLVSLATLVAAASAGDAVNYVGRALDDADAGRQFPLYVRPGVVIVAAAGGE